MHPNYINRDSLIPQRLRLAREQAGLSQGQVARALNIRRPAISEIESGKRRVSAAELGALSELYGVSMAWLCGQTTDGERDLDERVQLAARELANLRSEDLDSILRLLATLRNPRG